MHRRCLWIALAIAVLATAGCIGSQDTGGAPAPGSDGSEDRPPGEDREEADGEPVIRNSTKAIPNDTTNGSVDEGAGDGPPVTFSEPIRVTPEDRYGYEPSIEVGAEGTVYVTAHKGSLASEGTQLSSWFWYSTDNGTTWNDMPSLAQADNALWALEGDIALDDEGRIYFVDTWAADNTFSRWQSEGGVPEWDFSRPVHGTVSGDDRPWLAAAGDGTVYYIARSEDPSVDSGTSTAGEHVYTSTDGGLTWSLAERFPSTEHCGGIETPPSSPDRVAFSCRTTGGDVRAFLTEDGGETWSTETVGTYNEAMRVSWPSLSLDANETPYVGWIDGSVTTSRLSSLYIAYRGEEGEWNRQNVTPFKGSFQQGWTAATGEGEVAFVFYGTQDAPTGWESDWYPYALVTTDARALQPTWHLVRLTDEPVSADGRPLPGGENHPISFFEGAPFDFFQVVFGPENRMHVAFGQQTGDPAPTRTSSQEIHYVRQLTGPNLEGS